MGVEGTAPGLQKSSRVARNLLQAFRRIPVEVGLGLRTSSAKVSEKLSGGCGEGCFKVAQELPKSREERKHLGLCLSLCDMML